MTVKAFRQPAWSARLRSAPPAIAHRFELSPKFERREIVSALLDVTRAESLSGKELARKWLMTDG